MLVALAAIAILGAVGITLYQSYEDASAAASRMAHNTLLFMEREVLDMFGDIDAELRGLDDAFAQPAIRALPPADLERLFRQRSTGGLALADAEGAVEFSASNDFPRAANVAGRALFTSQRAAPGKGLYVTRPFAGADGKVAVAVSRARLDADGGFVGISIGVLPLSALHEIMAAAQLGSDGKISLYRNDGILLARTAFPGTTGADLIMPVSGPNGMPPTPDPLARHFRQASGSFDAIGPVDGLDRRYVYTEVPNLPLVVSVSLSMREIYESWSARAAYLAVVTGLSCVAIVTLTLLFRRELLRRARAEGQLAELATVDSLTGIANRRRFDERLSQEWRRSGRTGHPIGLVMIDVDNFKAFNDKHGHWLGDDLLIHIAGAISGALRRPGDMVARYGGEEFAIILPETPQEGVQRIAEHVRKAVAATGIEDATGRVVGTTASLGATSMKPPPGADLAQLVQLADAALYRAKKGGRNTVIMAPTADDQRPVAEAS
ncbi:two component system fusion protein [Azorhizobium oxalatiphilum]|uniref:diguanylate cyclase n=1 Tax=Azorhizobium oxalatiphilum TaxID=980631 RepID=A0A917C1I2_9HYPH|nr:two component system fusion protein [Azorhizobium oxalatiphilum]